jgi:riboflavin kinase/FMN adenylyltransferase
MRIIDDLTQANLRSETILTIGAFDGVHRGHQALIGAVVERARATDRQAAVLTFHPHPVAVLAPHRAPAYLTTLGEKMAILEDLGVDLAILLPFNQQVAAMPARDFVVTIVRHLRPGELWVGSDFALGKNRKGDVRTLRALGGELGFSVQVFEPIPAGNEAVSSSRIRSLLKEGEVRRAAAMLGRYPSLSGQVVEGARRGHGLGFPTANLEVRAERAVPANGVYAVHAVLGKVRHGAVANIGVRPSFDNGQRTVEIHIFDFDQDIYGCDLVVEFVQRLRAERRFENIEDLIAQIEQDSAAARRILSTEGPMREVTRRGGAPCRYRYREVEHTADRALWVRGEELSDLFAGAAWGMYSLMGDLHGLVATHWKTLDLEAVDGETLLVDWLNELLYYTEMEELLFLDFRIEAVSAAPESLIGGGPQAVPAARLVAQVGGVRAPVTRAHIKAATFHNLELVEDSDGWSTLITFDV